MDSEESEIEEKLEEEEEEEQHEEGGDLDKKTFNKVRSMDFFVMSCCLLSIDLYHQFFILVQCTIGI